MTVSDGCGPVTMSYVFTRGIRPYLGTGLGGFARWEDVLSAVLLSEAPLIVYLMTCLSFLCPSRV